MIVNTSDPLMTVSASPNGLSGLEWSTTVLAKDTERLTRAQIEARLIEAAMETDRKLGVELEANRTLLESNRLLLKRITSAEAALTQLPKLLVAGEAAVRQLLAKPPATPEQIRIIDELRVALDEIRSVTTPPSVTDAAPNHYTQVKTAYDLLNEPLPLDRDRDFPQE